MTLDDLSWILVALSLLGNVFVIKKNVAGQWLWAISNLGWVGFNLAKDIYSSAFLFGVYFAMCVWGITAWTRDKKKASVAESVS